MVNGEFEVPNCRLLIINSKPNSNELMIDDRELANYLKMLSYRLLLIGEIPVFVYNLLKR